MRSESLHKLLLSVEVQTYKLYEIIVVDGSTDDKTQKMISQNEFQKRLPLSYYKVSPSDRGLTKQRNFGISKVNEDCDVVAFLDDDIELDKDYFLEIEKIYKNHTDAVAVGGISTNEVQWQMTNEKDNDIKYFVYDGWKRREDLRYRLRKLLNLVSNRQPGKIVEYGHERSIGFLPPSGKYYETDFLMGGIATYKKDMFRYLSFSSFFEGYGLYEDKDFSLRVRRYGKIYINTNAKVEHHHDPLGRPNYIKYGEMVVWNGWRVWRVATPSPSIKAILKWWSITILLTYVRLANAIVGKQRKDALLDFVGRHISMFKLIFKKPLLD
jgi:glycosyltransferase involved in cell wall biosynthesis